MWRRATHFANMHKRPSNVRFAGECGEAYWTHAEERRTMAVIAEGGSLLRNRRERYLHTFARAVGGTVALRIMFASLYFGAVWAVLRML